jgi:hypothetical protein
LAVILVYRKHKQGSSAEKKQLFALQSKKTHTHTHTRFVRPNSNVLTQQKRAFTSTVANHEQE